MHRMIIGLIFITALSIAVSAQEIEPGECWSESIYVPMNQTYNNTFNVCAVNCTPVNTTEPYFELNFTLNPEQKLIVNDTNYNITMYCTNVSSTQCVVHKTLNPGDVFNQYGSSCDIEIDVNEEDCPVCSNQIATSYNEEFRIRYSNESKRIQIDFAGEEYITQLNSKLDVLGELKYECPTDVINESSAVVVTAERCRALGEVYCGDAFDLIANKFDNAETKRQEYENKWNNCQTNLVELQKDQVCMTNQEYADMQTSLQVQNNETETCLINEGMTVRDLEQTKSHATELSVVLVLSIIGNIYLYMRGPVQQKKSAVG